MDLRLLKLGVLVSSLLTAACFVPRPWIRTVEGRVTDAVTGEPVAGAEVFTFYTSGGAFSQGNFFEGSAPTDEDGRFRVAGHLAPYVSVYPVGVLDWRPHFFVYHRDYGVGDLQPIGDDWPWRDVSLVLRPDPHSMKLAKDPENWGRLCGAVPGGDEPCKRLCELAYGAAEKCPPWGEWKR